jgi:protein-L-isoaspartate(D-aspartate) O-methyltransferase
LSLYDNQRREIETVVLGPARGSRPWRTMSRLVRVPPQAREGMIRIGLFGATGVADFDELKIEVVK